MARRAGIEGPMQQTSESEVTGAAGSRHLFIDETACRSVFSAGAVSEPWQVGYRLHHGGKKTPGGKHLAAFVYMIAERANGPKWTRERWSRNRLAEHTKTKHGKNLKEGRYERTSVLAMLLSLPEINVRLECKD